MTGQNWQGRVAVITGASGGIGAAAARRLVKEGLRVALVGRSEERLARLAAEISAAGGEAEVFQADLSREEGRLDVQREVLKRHGGADVLFNNAGVGWYGYFARMPWSQADELVRTNITAVVHLTSLFLPSMMSRGRGHVINMGSLTGILPVQGAVMYGASKAFLDSFTSALYRELSGTPVRVSVICSSAIRTEFFQRATAQPGAFPLPGQAFAVPPEEVAEAVWSLLCRPRRVVYVPGWVRLVQLVEPSFGWLMDMLGPVLLKRADRNA